MDKIIEVYIKNEEALTQPTLVQTVPGHPCSTFECYKSEKIVPEADQAALKVAEEISEERGAKLKVYDVSTFKGKMWALLKGIKRTPTIVIGKDKIEGVPEKKQLISLLES
jgi:hypothetical protein